MCTYLHGPRGSIYYFRRGIPSYLRAALGKREFLFSLGTKDRAEAKKRIPDLTKKIDALMERALASLASQASGLAVVAKDASFVEFTARE